MHLPTTPDLSVYQLALDNLVSNQPLKVSLLTLKSLVRSLIDVLIEEKISATIWVKLPPKQGLQEELKRYQQQVDVPHTIYLCSSCEEDLVDVSEVVSQASSAKEDSHVFPVQLAAGNQLKREYFIIVLCQVFSCLVVAYPPELGAKALHKTQPLLAICSFKQEVIQPVLEGITGVIAVTDITPTEILECWETRFSLTSASDEKAMLTQLLVKQLSNTEQILSDRLSYSATTTPPLPNDELHNNEELFQRIALELRTPLANMKTALRLLDSVQLKLSQRQLYMQLLHTECDRQSSLIAGFLELVKLNDNPQPTVMPPVQLADIVPGIVSTYQPLAQEKSIQLGYIIPAGLPCVSCLETWLRQIVINLLHNSLKFTLPGGQVRVMVTLQGNYVQLEFSDTGVGIAANEISRIFDSFYRGRSTTNENTGVGLGLTIVQQLLLRCGGSISVTSKLGEGSNFKVLLPVVSPKVTENNF